MSTDDDPVPAGIDELTALVKSRILDRVIADLRDAPELGRRASGYTRSDSGIYGKYQKHDVVDMDRVLKAVAVETERLLAHYCATEPDDRGEGKQ